MGIDGDDLQDGAAGRDDAIERCRGGLGIAREETGERGLERVEEGVAVGRRDEGGRAGLAEGLEEGFGRNVAVGLRHHDEKGFARFAGQGQEVGVRGLTVVGDNAEDEVGTGDGLLGAGATGGAEGGGVVPAAGVEPEDGAEGEELHRLFHHVGGGAGLGGDDGDVLARDSVEQGGFADVGTADEGDGEAEGFRRFGHCRPFRRPPGRRGPRG